MADMIRFTGVKKFDRDLKRIAKEFDIKVDQVIRKVGFALFAGFTKRTPVDTGYARANWLISTNEYSANTLDKSGFPDGVKNRSKAASINRQMRASLKPDKNRESLWITNSVPYIQFLEAGNSKQMDKGFMVQRTLAEVQEKIDQELADLYVR